MAQQGPIMKPGVSHALTVVTANTPVFMALTPGTRYCRITASAPAFYVLANAMQSQAVAAAGIYAPGTTFGPDIMDVEGYSGICATAPAAGTILYITELSA